ncbi:minor capsid protein [Fusobacterium polymorphum]|uniref:minor capsid protein n=1 Tax=Fusobacterium nucleatum subsp. polymorphum TaxID=76857 RepID=UPI0021C3D057|nr:minor capsid protein [Fusobacterium polymorphum]
MAQKNRDYWEERQVKREAKAFTTIQDIEKEYKIALEKAKQNINKEIARITTTYMNDNILNYNEALKLLKGDDYKVWKKDLHSYMKEYKNLLKTAPLDAQKLYLEIETLSAKSRISRLDSLKAQIDMEFTKLIFGVEDSAKNALTSVYRDTFIEVTKDLGINAIVSRDKIKTVLDRPWSGANFSQRIWSNTDKLAQTVKQEIVNGMIQGINLQTMAKRVSERFETAKKNDVERLLRTEVNYTLNQATLDGYKEAGIEKYEFSATLDSRTSQICSELHGEVFEIKKIAVGLNYPPMHPRCRSTTIPIVDYENLIKQGREEIGEKDIESNEKEALTNNENKSITKEPVPNTFTMAWAQNDKVEYNEVKKLQKELTTEEIIKKIGGGDQTKGSCSSLAFAYIGNRNGYDVLDFRGGISTEIFATTRNIVEIANLDGIESKVIKRANDYNAVKELLTFVEEKKEYYLETGKHAAIIRIGNRGFEYLELQSETENGFKKLDSSVLKTRFGCQASYSVGGIKFEKSNVLIDVDSCKNSEEFKNLLGYINTAKDKQNKGEGGYAK